MGYDDIMVPANVGNRGPSAAGATPLDRHGQRLTRWHECIPAKRHDDAHSVFAATPVSHC